LGYKCQDINSDRFLIRGAVRIYILASFPLKNHFARLIKEV